MPGDHPRLDQREAGDVGGDGDRRGDDAAEPGEQPLGAGVADVVVDDRVDRRARRRRLLAQLLVGRLGRRRQRTDAVDGPVQRLADERRGEVGRQMRARGARRACVSAAFVLEPMRRSYGASGDSLRSRRAGRAAAVALVLRRPVGLRPARRPGRRSAPTSSPGPCWRRTGAGSSRCRRVSRGDPMCWFCPVRRGVLPLDRLRRLEVAAPLAPGPRDPGRHGVRGGRRRVRRPAPALGLDRRGHPARRTSGCTSSAGRTRWRPGATAGSPAGCTASAIGGLFAGESMFHRERDASKVALVGLVDLLDDEHGPTGCSTCSG